MIVKVRDLHVGDHVLDTDGYTQVTAIQRPEKRRHLAAITVTTVNGPVTMTRDLNTSISIADRLDPV